MEQAMQTNELNLPDGIVMVRKRRAPDMGIHPVLGLVRVGWCYPVKVADALTLCPPAPQVKTGETPVPHEPEFEPATAADAQAIEEHRLETGATGHSEQPGAAAVQGAAGVQGAAAVHGAVVGQRSAVNDQSAKADNKKPSAAVALNAKNAG